MEGVKTKWVKRKARILIGVLLLWPLMGCSNNGSGDNAVSGTKTEQTRAERQGAMIARIGDSGIGLAEFKTYLAERPISRQSESTAEALAKRLDTLVIEEVLYQEARRRKLDQDPGVHTLIRQLVTRKLIEEQVNKPAWERPIEEAELKAYYDRHEMAFNRPEQVRLADIFISVSPDATDRQRDEARQRAEAALAEALRSRQQRTGFGDLIRRYSDTSAQYPMGDTGFFDIKGQPAGVDVKLAQAGFSLKSNGDIPDHVIETPQGYHVIMRVGKRSAVSKPLTDVRRQIEREIRREEAENNRREFIDSLKKGADIQIDDQLVAGVVKDINASREKQVSSKNNQSMHKGSKTDHLPPGINSEK